MYFFRIREGVLYVCVVFLYFLKACFHYLLIFFVADGKLFIQYQDLEQINRCFDYLARKLKGVGEFSYMINHKGDDLKEVKLL